MADHPAERSMSMGVRTALGTSGGDYDLSNPVGSFADRSLPNRLQSLRFLMGFQRKSKAALLGSNMDGP